MNKLVIFVFAALVLICASNVWSAPLPEVLQAQALLKQRTDGNDAFLNKLLSPAKSLDLTKNSSERIQAVNATITNEINLVLSAFKTAAEDKKVEAVHAAIQKIEPSVLSEGGADMSFIEGNPSAATSRTVVLISKKNKAVTAASVLNILSSYKRSAKLSDYIYEYENPQNLTSGAIKESQGTDTTWVLPEAAAPLALAQGAVLKKCRQLLGWRCVTSFYRADALLRSKDSFYTLFISIVDLAGNPDHPDFSSDKRSKNQITGSTALYIVKESPEWVLIYGSDVQWNDGSLSFTGVIRSEFQKDFSRFKDRLIMDLRISQDDLK